MRPLISVSIAEPVSVGRLWAPVVTGSVMSRSSVSMVVIIFFMCLLCNFE